MLGLWGERVDRVMFGKPEGMRPKGRPRRKSLDNSRTDI